MLDDTWTAFCDRFTTTMGRVRYPTDPASRAHRLHHFWCSASADRGSSSGRAASSAPPRGGHLGHSPGLGSP
jgi:hypothetical protein